MGMFSVTDVQLQRAPSVSDPPGVPLQYRPQSSTSPDRVPAGAAHMLSGVLGSLGNALMGLAGGGPAAAGAAPAPPEPKPAPRRAPRPAPGPFAVGAPVFVEVDSQATWLTGATVALANDDGTYDVILADDADHNGVPPELLHAAPDADLPGAMDRGGALKERGNGAFRAGDVGGAVAAYQEAVAHLEWAVLREAEAEPAAGAPLSVGARVRLRDRRSGTIACLSGTPASPARVRAMGPQTACHATTAPAPLHPQHRNGDGAQRAPSPPPFGRPS